MSFQPVTQQSGRMRGALLGLSAAALFGASAPVSKLLLGQTAPQMLAALLYLGAGVGLLLVRGRRRSQQEAPLRREDWPYLAGIVITGGMIGPVLMLHGLRQVSGVAGSLPLNLEAPFTIAVAASSSASISRAARRPPRPSSSRSVRSTARDQINRHRKAHRRENAGDHDAKR